MKTAVIGANGFVGQRLVEFFHLAAGIEVRPVVRSFAALAPFSRFAMDWRVANGCDAGSLTAALTGCDALINCVAGHAGIIADNARALLEAAPRAGVRRVVYLSSASVHGQAPSPDTREDSVLHTDHPIAYNNAKVRAERLLLAGCRRAGIELVVLRPAIIFGPRSRWLTTLADELLAGTAYLINHGRGVCNSIYVDNLIEGIRLALQQPNVSGEVFFLGDREPVTWGDFYGFVAVALGIDVDTIHQLEVPIFTRSLADQLRPWKSSAVVQRLLPLFPPQLKRAVKGAVNRWHDPGLVNPWADSTRGPAPTQEMVLLHQCQWRLPWEKAARQLGYQPPVPFAEACRRSAGWLQFAGYPVTAG